MVSKSKTLQAAFIGVVIAAGIIGGVNILSQNFLASSALSTSSSSSGTTTIISGTKKPVSTGVLAAQITDPPNAPTGVTSILVSYSSIEVHAEGVPDNSGWYTIASNGTIDLMSVVNVTKTLGSATVTSGLFTLVRIDITNATVTYMNNNYPAQLSSNTLLLPIISGGVAVESNSSAGFLIQMSPTVSMFPSGSTLGFVLVPNAKSLPVPQGVWNESWTQPGTVISEDNHDWLYNTNDTTTGSITISGASFIHGLSVTVKNSGSSSVTLSTVSMSAKVFSYINANTEGGTTTTTTKTSDGYTLLASFQILSNGTLVQPGDSSGDISTGYVLAAGQSQTFSYTSQISVPEGSDNSFASLQITTGASYLITVSTSYGVQATYSATA